MGAEGENKPKSEEERVIRGAEGTVIGYWFPEDFWLYQEYLMREQQGLIDRVRAVPMGSNFPRDLWLEMRSTFERFVQSLGRKYTDRDITMSTASIQLLAQGGTQNDKTHH